MSGATDRKTDSVEPVFRQLDTVLAQAARVLRRGQRHRSAGDLCHGLLLDETEFQSALDRAPGESPFAGHREGEGPSVFGPFDSESPFAWLADRFCLAPFDVDVVVLALAPDFDLRYERLYAYLQDDAMRRRPSIEFALNLLCPSAEAKLSRRSHFAPWSALVRNGIIQLVGDPSFPYSPLLSHSVKLEEHFVRRLLEYDGFDSRLAPYCRVYQAGAPSGNTALDSEQRSTLFGMAAQASVAGLRLCLYFQGPAGMGKCAAAHDLASACGAPMIAFDLERAAQFEPDLDVVARALVREAELRGAVLYVERWDCVDGTEHAVAGVRMLRALAEYGGITILSGTKPWTPPGRSLPGILVVPFRMPDFRARRALWNDYLVTAGVSLDAAELAELADRYQLTPEQIADAVETAVLEAWRRDCTSNEPTSFAQPTSVDLSAAARRETGQDLALFARKVTPFHGWNDLVLPDDSVAQLRELCQQVKQRRQVLDAWGFGRKFSLGKGANALFVGPPGTGKTTAAEIVALELGLDLYEIDLSRVVSKYIGEMQKCLDKIFAAAEQANAILCFHEADALFGKRLETRDAHDVFVNQDIAYLLQKVEQYEGVAILTTNLRQNMDEAFTRRLQFIVEFPFPDEPQRKDIWRVLLPDEAPRDEQIDFRLFAKHLRIAGGNIKNIVLSAAYLAAHNGGRIDSKHLLHAARREYKKMGKLWDMPEPLATSSQTVKETVR